MRHLLPILSAALAAGAAQAGEPSADPVSTSAAYAYVGVADGVSAHGAQVRIAHRLAPWLGLEGEARRAQDRPIPP